MVTTAEGRSFMTPAQQRAYLNELRSQNDQLYGLTGVRSGSGRNPWDTPSSSAREDQDPPRRIEAESTNPVQQSKSKSRPAIPPKSNQVRALPSPPVPKPTAIFRSVGKPRLLPKPPSSKITLPDLARLDLDRSPSPRYQPEIAPKPVIQSGDDLPAARMVSLSLTHYDLSHPPGELRGQSEVPEIKIDEASSGGHGRVSIPTFNFSDHDDPLGSKTEKPVHPASSNANIPSFSFSGPDGIDSPAEQSQNLPTFSISGTDDPSETRENPSDGRSATSQPRHQRRMRKRRAPIPSARKTLVERGLNCANCYDPLGRGRIITANNRRYHPSHFLCFECNIPLEHVEFYVHKGSDEDPSDESEEVYCHFDYHELFTPRCHYCTTPVIRDGIRALGRVYHAEHFFCALCSQTFMDDSGDGTTFVEKDGMAWHAKCYEEKFSTSYLCRKCKKRIEAGGQVITMGTGSHFHPECFQCAHCKGSLEKGFYWSKAKEGICKPCMEIEVKEDLW